MFHSSFRHRGATAALIAVLLVGIPAARAQVSPIGAHDVTVGPGAGLNAPVSPTGGFAAVVPMDLPPSRSGIPVPLQVRYTGGVRAGAAGSGWDMPLSYLRFSTSTTRRKPAIPSFENDGTDPSSAPMRVFAVVDGASMLMVPSQTPGNYVPFAAETYMELRPNLSQSKWVLEVIGGRRYEFTYAPVLSGNPFEDPSLWLLTAIYEPAANDRMSLSYTFSGSQINLSNISHTFDASGGVAMFEIDISYVDTPRTVAIEKEEDRTRSRNQIVGLVTVKARDNTAKAPTVLWPIRSYRFEYADDPETTLPRLWKVHLSGEDGQSERVITTYGYGPRSRHYDGPTTVKRSFSAPGGDMTSVYGGALSTSIVSPPDPDSGPSDHRPYPSPPSSTEPGWGAETLYTRHVIRDFTGDGLPDLVFKKDATWYLYPNVTSDTGTDLATGPAYTWSEPSEIFVQTTVKPSDHVDPVNHRPYPGHQTQPVVLEDTMTTSETWVQFLDWNGDGRMDVVDARGSDTHNWKVWINEGTANGHVVWRTEKVLIDNLRRSWISPTSSLPLARSRSWPRIEWSWRKCEKLTTDPSVDCPPAATYEPRSEVAETDTFIEWQLVDLNGDGYPDFHSNRQPVYRCDQEYAVPLAEGGTSTPLFKYTGENHWQYAQVGWCPEWVDGAYDYAHDEIEHEEYINTGGALFNPSFYLFRSRSVLPGAVGHWVNGELEPVYTPDPSDSEGPGWSDPTRLDPGPSFEERGFVDPDGDGLGRIGTSWARFETDRDEKCSSIWAPPSTTFVSRQVEGLVDISGDGIPDHLEREALYEDHGQWWVRYGTGVDKDEGGARFGPKLELTGFGVEFELAYSEGTCAGPTQAKKGLEDIDGDGVPEFVYIENGNLVVQRLSSDVPGFSIPNAGRLVAIENGQGATTRIAYANNKTDRKTAHQLPFPEIVVQQVSTDVADGSAGINPTYYAYGNARLTYDPVLARWAFAGYQREIALTGDPSNADTFATGLLLKGIAVVTDRAPQSATGAGYQALLHGGRVVRTSRLEDNFFSADPRELLLANVDSDSRVRAANKPEYVVVELPISSDTTGIEGEECFDADGLTGDYPLADEILCRRAGLIVTWKSTAWEGTAAPPSMSNVQTGSYVGKYDQYGRPLQIVDQGDLRTHDDDTCTNIDYAVPTAASANLLTVPSKVQLTDCGWDHPIGYGDWATPGPVVTRAGMRYHYDGLPQGQVTSGRLTKTIVERYDANGQKLSEFTGSEIQYHPYFGLPTKTFRPRSLGTSAIQTTDLTYDLYGATVEFTNVSATDVDVTLTRHSVTPVWPHLDVEVKEPTGEAVRVHRDEFGRVKDRLVKPAGDDQYFVQLHNNYTDTPGNLKVETVAYYGSTPEGSSSTDRTLVGRTYFDALGRTKHSELDLGADYNNSQLVTGYYIYDNWGRVKFEGAPFQSPSRAPADSLPYGTSYAYDAGGRVIRRVSGPGLQTGAVSSNAANDVYPTRFDYGYANGTRIERVWTPNQNTSGSSTYGTFDVSVYTGSGRAISTYRQTSTGARIDRVDRVIDRLGRLVATRRFKSPVGTGSDIVEWSSTYDSLGNVLSQSEPQMSAVTYAYDEWGAPLKTEWLDGSIRRVTTWAYDGFGRVTERRLDAIPQGMNSGTNESTEYYYYDEYSGDPNQPASTASMLGRLSWAESMGVSRTFYAYGYNNFDNTRLNSQTVVHVDEPLLPYSTTTKITAAGTTVGFLYGYPGGPQGPIVEEVDYAFDSAGRTKLVTFDDGTSTKTLFTATQIDALGRYRAITLGNGATETMSYQPSGRQELAQWEIVASGQSRTVTYDQFDSEMRVKTSGERTRLSPTDTSPFSYTSYAYDSLDRLKDAATSGATVKNFRYEYDNLGNLTKFVDAVKPTASLQFTYSSSDKDRLSQTRPLGATNPIYQYNYDGAGNVVQHQLVSMGGMTNVRTFKYDSSSRIRQMQKGSWNASFKYGPAGDLAVEEVSNYGTLNRRIRHYGALLEKRTRPDGGTALERYIPGPLGVFASVRGAGSGSIVYIHGDGRANKLFTRANGTIAQEATYQPYGETSTATNTSNQEYSDDLFNGGGNYPEFGIVMLGARIYDPLLSRFLQRDPIALSPQTTKGNPYAFSWNDPVNRTDPTGLTSLPYLQISSSAAFLKISIPLVVYPIVAGIVYFTADEGCQQVKSGNFSAGRLITAAVAGATFGGLSYVNALANGKAPWRLAAGEGLALSEANTLQRTLNGDGTSVGDVAWEVFSGASMSYMIGRVTNEVLARSLRSEVEAAKGLRVLTDAELATVVGGGYRENFFSANPALQGRVYVHHAIEQQVLVRYPGTFTEAEIHALSNLRGIPISINSSLHLSELRIEWNRFYAAHATATRQELFDFAAYLDAKYGSQFNPPTQ